MTRILFVAQEVPDATSGGRKRVFNLMRELAHRGYELALLAGAFEHDDARIASLERLGILCYRVPLARDSPVPERSTNARTWRSALLATPLGSLLRSLRSRCGYVAELVRSIANPVARDARLSWVTPLQHALRELLQHERFDLILVENLENALLADLIDPGVPLVLDAQNVLSSVADRECRLVEWSSRFSLAFLDRWLQVAKLRSLERYALQRYDAVVAMSELDAVRLRSVAREEGAACIVVVENGVDTSCYRSVGLPAGQAKVLFTGLMGYKPNVDGMCWFLSEVWPRVLAHEPDAQLDVVGAEPDPALFAAAAPHAKSVRVTGWVENVAPFFETADVVVAPLRLGGGTRLKILEAAAMRRPIVATSMAAEGLDGLHDEQHLLLRDTPDAFADAVLGLLADRARGAGLAAAARVAVEQHYDWALLGQKLHLLIGGLLSPVGGAAERNVCSPLR